jgi:parvulin-like peptidyl-prolyl isomerase
MSSSKPSKKQSQTGGYTPSRKDIKQTQKKQAEQVAVRRSLTKKQREQQKQRRLIMIVGAAVGLAVLALLGGILYDRVWLPARPVAAVNDTTLTRSEYWEERRLAVANQIAQNMQFLLLFGNNPQFRDQFAGQSPALNQQVSNLRNEAINTQFIDQWQRETLIRQGAETLDVQATDGEVAQTIATELGSLFLPAATTPISPTDALTDTQIFTETDVQADEEDVAADADATDVSEADADTADTEEDTADEPVTPTLAPTATPLPTPGVEVATEQVPQIAQAIYDQYLTELELTGQDPALTPEDFEQALRENYRQQVLEEEIRAALVPEDEFTASDEPERVQARQILLSVDPPADASEEEIEEAYDERREDAEQLVEQLREGADFAELAEEESDDPGSREQGGDVGFFTSEGTSDSGAQFAPAFVDAAFALEEGEISDPVRTQFGWHIIEVTERIVPEEEQQLRDARAEAFDEWLESFREQSEVETFIEGTPTPEIPGVSGTPTTPPTPVPTYLPGPPTPLPTLTPTSEATPATEPDTSPPDDIPENNTP